MHWLRTTLGSCSEQKNALQNLLLLSPSVHSAFREGHIEITRQVGPNPPKEMDPDATEVRVCSTFLLFSRSFFDTKRFITSISLSPLLLDNAPTLLSAMETPYLLHFTHPQCTLGILHYTPCLVRSYSGYTPRLLLHCIFSPLKMIFLSAGRDHLTVRLTTKIHRYT